jgi:hypothetical protein
MKAIIAVAAALLTSAAAQVIVVVEPVPISTPCQTTVTVGQSQQTVTYGITSYYCPVCTNIPGPGGIYTTIYTTAYPAICPTGLTSSVHTITETGSGIPVPPAPTYIPPGFTTTVTPCNVCGPASSTVTLTVPCTSCGPVNTPAAQTQAAGQTTLQPAGTTAGVNPPASSATVAAITPKVGAAAPLLGNYKSMLLAAVLALMI